MWSLCSDTRYITLWHGKKSLPREPSKYWNFDNSVTDHLLGSIYIWGHPETGKIFMSVHDAYVLINNSKGNKAGAKSHLRVEEAVWPSGWTTDLCHHLKTFLLFYSWHSLWLWVDHSLPQFLYLAKIVIYSTFMCCSMLYSQKVCILTVFGRRVKWYWSDCIYFQRIW